MEELYLPVKAISDLKIIFKIKKKKKTIIPGKEKVTRSNKPKPESAGSQERVTPDMPVDWNQR